MNDNKEYHIEQLSEHVLEDVTILHKAVYGYVLQKNYLLQKYNTAYTGVQHVGHIAYDNKNNPVAFFTVIPCFIQYGIEIILAAQAVDAMTHPQHRHKSLFVKLVKATTELCKEKGIRLIFGFPNQNSYYGLAHTLGWKVAENMERFSIRTNTFPLLSLTQHHKWIQWLYNKYTAKILRKYLLTVPGVSSSVTVEGYGGMLRNEQYLQYKRYSKTQVLQIGNSKVWIKIKDDLIIGDLSLCKDDFDNVMSTLKKIVKFLGITSISFQVSPGTTAYKLFSQKYKPEASFPVILLNLGIDIPLNNVKFTFADIDIF